MAEKIRYLQEIEYKYIVSKIKSIIMESTKDCPFCDSAIRSNACPCMTINYLKMFGHFLSSRSNISSPANPKAIDGVRCEYFDEYVAFWGKNVVEYENDFLKKFNKLHKRSREEKYVIYPNKNLDCYNFIIFGAILEKHFGQHDLMKIRVLEYYLEFICPSYSKKNGLVYYRLSQLKKYFDQVDPLNNSLGKFEEYSKIFKLVLNDETKDTDEVYQNFLELMARIFDSSGKNLSVEKPFLDWLMGRIEMYYNTPYSVMTRVS